MPCFCTFGVLMLSALLTSTKFEFSYDTKDRKGENKHNGIINSLKKNLNLKYVIFLVTVFYFGILNAFTKTFLFWYLKDLGGTQLLFSVITAVNALQKSLCLFHQTESFRASATHGCYLLLQEVSPYVVCGIHA